MIRLRFASTSLVMLLALFLTGKVFAQNFSLLSELRDDIVFEELAPEEKTRLAEQLQLIIQETYVNRLAKQDFYPGVLDPLAEINAVVDQASELSTEDLETRLATLVLSQRDFHFNYLFPPPYNRYVSLLPLTFERTSSRRDPFQVRVSAVNEELFTQFSPDARVPELGDRIVGYNGVPTREAIDALIPVGGGANTWGGFKNGMDLLTSRTHLLHFVPEEDEVTLDMRSQSSGERYTVNLPWLAFNRFGFADNSMLLESELETKDTTAKDKQKPQERLMPGDWKMVDERQVLRNKTMKMAGLEPESNYPDMPTNATGLTWGIIENRFGTFGYMRLSTFITGFNVFSEIRRLSLNEFKNTDGLIFDVRNNGGGLAFLGEALPQLFGGSDIESNQWQLLNSETNQRTFSEVFRGDAQILEALDAVAGTDAIFSERYNLFTAEDLNFLGQVYFKPVGILANARSYSATDLFTCTSQDNGAAIIYGEDPRTGAGGATVVEQTLFLGALGAPYEALPAGHRFRTAWFQVIRSGLNEGQLIEDFGCEADVDVSPVTRDLVSGSEAQIQKITRDLARRSRSFEFFSQAQPLDDPGVATVDINDASYQINTRGTRSIRIYRNGQVAKDVNVFSGFQFEEAELDLSDVLEPGSNDIVLRGIDYRGNESWNFKFTFIALDLNMESVPVSEAGVVFDFATTESIDPFSIFNLGNPEGWRFESPFLQVGFPAYVDGLNTEALLRLDLTALEDATLIIDFGLDTEAGFDQFDIYVTVDEVLGDPIPLLEPLSGSVPFATQELSLSEFAGQEDVYLHFRFRSDGSIVAPGVQIGKVEIQ